MEGDQRQETAKQQEGPREFAYLEKHKKRMKRENDLGGSLHGARRRK